MPDLNLKYAFPPTVDDETRVLLLGSLPGERSLEVGEYYAHPSNGFWWLLGEVLDESGLPGLPYDERLERLRAHHIGLWDVIASARRSGSLDGAIREATHRDLATFAKRLPRLKAIGFNGGTASRRGRRELGQDGAQWALIDLPSSSAAFASMSRAMKLAAWRSIATYLG